MASYTELAWGYAQDVVSGTIPVCIDARRACQRFLDDVERIGEGDWPYTYDPEKAHRACAFIERLPHVKGKWAVRARGQKKLPTINLEPWQAFFVCNVFGWVHGVTGLRRFTEADLFVPRKNGKSLLAAGIALYMICEPGEAGAEVYSGATSREQALEVFRPAWQIVNRSPDLKARLGIDTSGTDKYPQGIYRAATGARFLPVKGKPGDGASPSCWIVDEYHEHQNDAQVDTARTGMIAREQPLLLIITTAGDNIAGPCYQKQEYLRQILAGLVENDNIFGIIYTCDEGDDWRDAATLQKANPNWGVSVLADQVMNELQEALHNPGKQSSFKTKHLNIWVGSASPFFNLELWLQAGDPTLTPDDLDGEPCWMGTDAASKLDLTSTCLVFRRMIEGKSHYYFFWRHYLPAGRIDSPDNPNKQYMAWRDADIPRIIPTDGNATDFDLLEADVIEWATQYRASEWAYDERYLRQMSQHVEGEGITVVHVPPHVTHLSNPMKELQSLIIDGRVHHDGDPVAAWALANVTSKTRLTDDSEYPRKPSAEAKIDPMLAAIMALGRALSEPEPKGERENAEGLLY